MVRSVQVVGAGRAGSAIAARLREREVDVEVVGGTPPFPPTPPPRPPARTRAVAAELVLLCVPDRAIAEVAREIRPGPWVAPVSGATPLAALDPHRRRFSVHPLQTLVTSRGPEQLDGAFAAVTADDAEARGTAIWLARTLGLEPFELRDANRALYHAGAMVASGFLVALYRAAAELAETAGAPADALVPLMQRTIENGFELTGPISRGDWGTVDAHRRAIRER